ncbi:MAG: lysozyme inhibitor LprI family protein [Myxococcales bacterium]
MRCGGATAIACWALVALPAGSAAGASFDCSRPSLGDVARLICSTPELNRLDAEMGEAYRETFFLLGRGALGAQRRWIRERSRCGPAVACLEQKTRARLAELGTAIKEARDDAAILGRLSVEWVKDGDLGEHQGEAWDNLHACPPASLDLDGRDARLVPGSYVRLRAIATRDCRAILKVYLGCTRKLEEPEPSRQWVAADGKWFACGRWNERLVLEEFPSRRTRLLADLEPEHRTGNSGALFVPVAFAEGDRFLVLQPWMGRPGAGGGDVVYGDELLSIATGRTAATPSGRGGSAVETPGGVPPRAE